MENKKEIGSKDELEEPLKSFRKVQSKERTDFKDDESKQYLDFIRGGQLYGMDPLPGVDPLKPDKNGPKIYECSECKRKFVAADVLWKDLGDGKQEPVCVECRKPLKEYNKTN